MQEAYRPRQYKPFPSRSCIIQTTYLKPRSFFTSSSCPWVSVCVGRRKRLVKNAALSGQRSPCQTQYQGVCTRPLAHVCQAISPHPRSPHRCFGAPHTIHPVLQSFSLQGRRPHCQERNDRGPFRTPQPSGTGKHRTICRGPACSAAQEPGISGTSGHQTRCPGKTRQRIFVVSVQPAPF